MRRVLAIGFTVMLAVGVLIAQQPQNPMVRGEEHRRRPTQSVHLSETITTTPYVLCGTCSPGPVSATVPMGIRCASSLNCALYCGKREQNGSPHETRA
jgi:hypothetical protein